ncbi:MAG: hypothetical protein GXP37_02255 [Chloroflexi bacterium]|nr:hypothetical protein [Chloroflexota bacterium]
MSDSSRKPRRRRPRRRPAKPKTDSPTAAPEAKKAEASAAPNKNRPKRSRRPRRRSRDQATPTPERNRQDSLQVHHYDSLDADVQPLDKNAFIYTYTLRPRSYLDNYQAGPAVAERMAFEGPDQD